MDVDNEVGGASRESSDNIAVCVRVRPQETGATAPRASSGSAVAVDAAAKSLHIGGQTFAFDHAVGPDSTQVSAPTLTSIRATRC